MRALAIVACLLAGCAAFSEPDPFGGPKRDWVNANPASAPGAMQGAKLTFDGDRGRVVMYTGKDHDTIFGLAYEWNGQDWSPICGDPRPPNVYLPGFAWHPTLGLVLAGGSLTGDLTMPSKDVWACKNNVWLHIGVLNTARSGGELVFDPQRNELVLVGGRGADNLISFEYSTNGATWTQLDTPFESAGAGESATYDTSDGRILALEGELEAGDIVTLHDGVWEMASDTPAHTWQPVCDGCSGVPKSDASIVHIEGTNENWIVGGYIGNSAELSGTSLLDNDKLLPIIPNNLPARNAVGLASDPTSHEAIAYGGAGTACASTSFECHDTYILKQVGNY